MSTSTSLGKVPCLNCRESHQKCDKRRPVCRRCETKKLDCQPVQRKAVFRHGSTANLDASFAHAQTWVNSRPKRWRPTARPSRSSRSPVSPSISYVEEAGPMDGPSTPNELIPENQDLFAPVHDFQSPQLQQDEHVQTASPGVGAPINQSHHGHQFGQNSPFSISSSPHSSLASNPHLHVSTNLHHSTTRNLTETYFSELESSASPPVNQGAVTSFGSVQESCLLKYFIEELSPWFDHCDDLRHFQLVVPRRAQHCATLRNALFAVAALHLSRLPKYKTSNGVVYCGQSLPNLTKSSALEYMLKCIPDLIHFPEIQDPIHQENIMAATVILRQYEEMEEEPDESNLDGDYLVNGRVNFLAITQTIIDTMITSPRDQSLATAAYWITIRQEIYYALTRETVPHLRFDADLWQSSSVANNMIIFAGQVAKWRWGQKQSDQWTQLKHQEQQLIHDSTVELVPILDLKADRRKGEIFPTIWYSFDVQVTAIQHFLLAQMLLTAENPHLETATRAIHRKIEAQVRSIVLKICGIGLNHTKVQPALLNAVIAITLYGEYFTDQAEREALVDIINRTKAMHAWPMRRPYQTLQHRWDSMDGADI